MFNTSFVAVPDFNRVDPLRISGPTTGITGKSTSRSNSELVLHATPIVNAPEVAILGVSKAAMKPVWNGIEFVPRLMMPLSLSYDHRVIDGASAARFSTYLAQVISDLRRGIL